MTFRIAPKVSMQRARNSPTIAKGPADDLKRLDLTPEQRREERDRRIGERIILDGFQYRANTGSGYGG